MTLEILLKAIKRLKSIDDIYAKKQLKGLKQAVKTLSKYIDPLIMSVEKHAAYCEIEKELEVK